MRYVCAFFVIGAVVATIVAVQSKEQAGAGAVSPRVAAASKASATKANQLLDCLGADEGDYDNTTQKLAHDQKMVEADKLRIEQDQDAMRALLDEAGQEHITIKGTWGTYYYDAPDAPLSFEKRHLTPKWMW